MGSGQDVLGQVHVDADPEDDTAVARLGEDPRGLAAFDQDVVRELDLRIEPGDVCDRLANGFAGDDRQLGEAGGLDGRLEERREEQAHAGRRMPAAPESSAALRLLLGQRHGALGVLVREHPLRGRTGLCVQVGMPEPPAEARDDRIRAQ